MPFWDYRARQRTQVASPPPSLKQHLRVPKPCAHHAQGTGGFWVGCQRSNSRSGHPSFEQNFPSLAFYHFISPPPPFKGYHPRRPTQQREAKLPPPAALQRTAQHRSHQHAAQPLAQLAPPSQKPRCGAAVPSGAALCSMLSWTLVQRCIPAAGQALRSSTAMPRCWSQAPKPVTVQWVSCVDRCWEHKRWGKEQRA